MNFVITEWASVRLDAALEAGADRNLLMAQLLMPPEEWELLRPSAWTPSDGISLQRYRVVDMDSSAGDTESRRLHAACADSREGCVAGTDVDEMLFVRPFQRHWEWNFGPEGSFGGENGGGYWIDVRRDRPDFSDEARWPWFDDDD